MFGLVVEVSARRREHGLPPFTVVSLGEWVRREVRFPNSMVDRITPVTTDDDRWPADDPRFAAAYTTALTALHTVGVRAVLGAGRALVTRT